jgi:predicted nucleic-acid-binding protein
MIGLDTNILVRYLTQDDAVQSERAKDLLDGKLTPAEPGFVSVVAMAETVWVLERTYDFSDQEIAAAVEGMLQADALKVENESEVFTAMIALKEGRGSFADALIVELGARAGCSGTLTFDQNALRLPGFQLA